MSLARDLFWGESLAVKDPQTSLLWTSREGLINTFRAEELGVPLPRSVEVSPRLPDGVEAGGLQSVV